MAGNLLYIPYTTAMIAGFMVIGVIFFIKKKTKLFLAVTLPIFAVVQFYFWNHEFNTFAKSYLFPSKEFVCEEYGAEMKKLSIPLPKRTVLRGKEDACSPFYSTYVSERYFVNFYKSEFAKMQTSGEVLASRYVQTRAKKGFEVEASSGNKVVILYEAVDNSRGLLTIKFSFE